jgi:adenylate kinase
MTDDPRQTNLEQSSRTPETRCALVLIGPPGTGKTTLARALGTKVRASIIEVGNLLEAEVRRGTALSRQIAGYKTQGKLVPSELVKQVLSDELRKADGEIVIFDGIPRSNEQISILFQLFKENALSLAAVLLLNVDVPTLLNRITGRRICTKCGSVYNIFTNPAKTAGICDRCGGTLEQRNDDRLEVVQARLKTYEHETIPVIDRFRKEFAPVLLEESRALPPAELLAEIWPFVKKHLRCESESPTKAGESAT